MANYSYKTDGEECEFEAENDVEAWKIAREEAKLTKAQIADGAWIRVFDAEGNLVVEVA
jgi:phage terminase Nu1 subunit (DNA packaging protein)